MNKHISFTWFQDVTEIYVLTKWILLYWPLLQLCHSSSDTTFTHKKIQLFLISKNLITSNWNIKIFRGVYSTYIAHYKFTWLMNNNDKLFSNPVPDFHVFANYPQSSYAGRTYYPPNFISRVCHPGVLLISREYVNLTTRKWWWTFQICCNHHRPVTFTCLL